MDVDIRQVSEVTFRILILSGEGYWAVGDTEEQAIASYKKIAGHKPKAPYNVIAIHPETTIYSDGSISYPTGPAEDRYRWASKTIREVRK